MTPSDEPTLGLFLREGTQPRVLGITARSDPARFPEDPEGAHLPRLSAASILARYAAAVAVGCLGPASPARVALLDTHDEGTALIQRFHLSLPAMPPEALGPLVTMARFSRAFGSSLSSLTIHEQDAVTVAEVDPRRLAPLPAPTLRFPFERASAAEGSVLKDGRAVVTFAAPARDETIARVRELFEAWGGILLAGFEGRPHPFSAGYVGDVVRHLPNEAVATLEQTWAPAPGWDALARGLDAIDREVQPIEKVEVY